MFDLEKDNKENICNIDEINQQIQKELIEYE